MRMRRCFQPSLDSMSSRIAPSHIGLLAPVISVAIPSHSGLTHAHQGGAVAMDSGSTDSTDPIIITPIPPGSPPTLPC